LPPVTDVLVTGATGTVGAAIAERIVGQGRSVRALVRSPERAHGLVPEGIELAAGDITDPASIRSALDGCSVVFHAAGIPEQWRLDPDDFKRINTHGTQNVVDAALAAGVERFVYTSTIDVFEWSPGVSFNEAQLDPHPRPTFYERSKQEADRAVVAALERGLDAVFVHPSAVYGPAPVLAAGLNDFLVRLVRRKIPAVLPGGMPVVHAGDVAEGHLRAEREAPPGGRYILSGPYLTLREIAEAVERAEPRARVPPVMPTAAAKALAVVGERIARITKRPPLIAQGELHFVTSHPVPDASRARQELDWSSRDFDAGVAATLADFRDRGWV
jgi:dihydroflavonol-4-reductase